MDNTLGAIAIDMRLRGALLELERRNHERARELLLQALRHTRTAQLPRTASRILTALKHVKGAMQ